MELNSPKLISGPISIKSLIKIGGGNLEKCTLLDRFEIKLPIEIGTNTGTYSIKDLTFDNGDRLLVKFSKDISIIQNEI